MHFKGIFSVFTLAALASAQSLASLISNSPQLSMLGDILAAYPSVAASLGNAIGVTLFAPSNLAIRAVASTLSNATTAQVQALLSYHVVSGRLFSTAFSTTPLFPATLLNDNAYDTVVGGQVVELALVDGAATVISGFKAASTIITPNLNYTGGVVHIIDKVLTIPPPPSTLLPAAGLTDLLGAVVATDLTSTLDTASEITLFAPSNAAFTAIGSAAGNLTTAQLARILSYHVVVGHTLYSSDIMPGSLPTLLGPQITISVEGEAVFVNGARIINTDILISGGVIHVIDAVLNPLNATAMPINGTTAVPQFASVSSAPLPAALTSGLPVASSTFSALAATTESVLAVASSGSAAA